MRALLQRVSHASVSVEGETVGKTGEGFLILLGVMQGDTEAQAILLAEKTALLRVFEDEAGKMNRSLLDIGERRWWYRSLPSVPISRKGRRPSFTHYRPAAGGKALYEAYVQALRGLGVARVETGVFAAHMEVSLLNHGPVTILLDTEEWARS